MSTLKVRPDRGPRIAGGRSRSRRKARDLGEWTKCVWSGAPQFQSSTQSLAALTGYGSRHDLGRPHGAIAVGPFDITHDANGNHIRTQKRDTGDVSQYLFDEKNRGDPDDLVPYAEGGLHIGNIVDREGWVWEMRVWPGRQPRPPGATQYPERALIFYSLEPTSRREPSPAERFVNNVLRFLDQASKSPWWLPGPGPGGRMRPGYAR